MLLAKYSLKESTRLMSPHEHPKQLQTYSRQVNLYLNSVAHYGIRKKEKNFKVEIRWTNGSKEMIDIKKLNQTIIVRQK